MTDTQKTVDKMILQRTTRSSAAAGVFRQRRRRRRRRVVADATLVALVVVVLALSTVVVDAVVSCQETFECQAALRPGSECVNGSCTNPFHKGGCLQRMSSLSHKWTTTTTTRICHSEDTAEAAAAGYCHLPTNDESDTSLPYAEIRIAGQNWESAFFQAWILQILLTELLHVPATIETGRPGVHLDFYHVDSPFDYGGVSYDWEALRNANLVEGGDCRLLAADNNDDDDDDDDPEKYQSCAHVIPEVWEGQRQNVRELEREAVIESPPQGMGALGQTSWFIPRFTGVRDPTLLTYLGLSGEANRRKLAETFLRPTTWKDYCNFVSPTNCQTPDTVAQRAPADETEATRMHVHGLYTGHFQATEENDCDKNPTTCTGHIVDFPCGWTSFVKQQTHHLNIALESSGEEKSGGYTYSQMTEIWGK